MEIIVAATWVGLGIRDRDRVVQTDGYVDGDTIGKVRTRWPRWTSDEAKKSDEPEDMLNLVKK